VQFSNALERDKHMKRYGNLYQKVCSLENIQLAHKNAKKGKGHYSEVKMVEANPEVSGIMSYYGWLKHCSCHRLWKSQIDVKVKSIVKRVCDGSSIRIIWR